MKKFDVIIIVVIIGMAAVLYFGGILSPKEKGSLAVVYVDGEEYTTLPLDTDTQIDVETQYGVNIISIKDGYADCIDADCRDGLCVNQRRINKVNQSIVCLPHKLVIEIEGAEQSKIDAVSE